MWNRNKRVFPSILIILFSILFAPAIDSQSEGETAVYEEYGFYIEYPSDWKIVDGWTKIPSKVFLGDFLGKTGISVSLEDKYEVVENYEKEFIKISNVDQSLLEIVTKNEQEACRSNIAGPCWDFVLLDSKIILIGEEKAISVKYSAHLDDEDTIIRIILLPDDENYWFIMGKALIEETNFDIIEKSMQSFDLKSIPVEIEPSEPAPTPGTDVSIPQGTSVPGCQESNECFLPASISTKVGSTVTWTNDDTAAHTVTSGTASAGGDGIFDSGLFMAGTTFSVKFDNFEPGVYPYYCTVHPWMVGTVILEEGIGEPTPSPTTEPSSNDIIIPSGTSVPGCEETNECFMPSSISINVGSTVTWTNDDSAGHPLTSGTVSASPDLTFSVTSDGRGVSVASGSVSVSPDGIFDGFLWEGDTFSVTFDKEGTYPYYSNVWQTGCIIVGRGDTTCPPLEPAPETAPFPSISDMEDVFSSFLDTQVCEEFLSVDEVKTAIGYAGELTPFSIRFPPNPQMPGLEYMCTNTFSKSLEPGSSNLALTVLVYDSAEPAIETFTVMSQNVTESSPSEIIEDVSETDWKYISAIIEDPSKGIAITSQKDRHVTVIVSYYSDFEPIADLPQLHEVAKIVWEKIDNKISTVSEPVKEIVPSWIKNNAKWWSEGTIGEKDFVGGIQYLIKEKIIDIPDLPETSSQNFRGMPIWVKNIAGYWADGLISDDEFIKSIQYLVEKGIIKV